MQQYIPLTQALLLRLIQHLELCWQKILQILPRQEFLHLRCRKSVRPVEENLLQFQLERQQHTRISRVGPPQWERNRIINMGIVL